MFVALPLTLFVPAVLPPFFGCVSGASEFELESYDSHLPGNVDGASRGTAGIIVVVDVESGEIPAAKNLALARKQLMRPGSTRKPFVLMDPDSGRLDPKQRLICRQPLRIRGMWLDCNHTVDVSQLEADDATVVCAPEGRGLDAAIVAHSVFEEHRQIKKKP